MKKSHILILLLAIGTGVSSCQKCAECTGCVIGTSSFCQDDFNTKDDYQAALDAAKAFGCDCTEKLK